LVAPPSFGAPTFPYLVPPDRTAPLQPTPSFFPCKHRLLFEPELLFQTFVPNHAVPETPLVSPPQVPPLSLPVVFCRPYPACHAWPLSGLTWARASRIYAHRWLGDSNNFLHRSLEYFFPFRLPLPCFLSTSTAFNFLPSFCTLPFTDPSVDNFFYVPSSARALFPRSLQPQL